MWQIHHWPCLLKTQLHSIYETNMIIKITIMFISFLSSLLKTKHNKYTYSGLREYLIYACVWFIGDITELVSMLWWMVAWARRNKGEICFIFVIVWWHLFWFYWEVTRMDWLCFVVTEFDLSEIRRMRVDWFVWWED